MVSNLVRDNMLSSRGTVTFSQQLHGSKQKPIINYIASYMYNVEVTSAI